MTQARGPRTLSPTALALPPRARTDAPGIPIEPAGRERAPLRPPACNPGHQHGGAWHHRRRTSAANRAQIKRFRTTPPPGRHHPDRLGQRRPRLVRATARQAKAGAVHADAVNLQIYGALAASIAPAPAHEPLQRHVSAVAIEIPFRRAGMVMRGAVQRDDAPLALDIAEGADPYQTCRAG
jgi:hypothetical protein